MWFFANRKRQNAYFLIFCSTDLATFIRISESLSLVGYLTKWHRAGRICSLPAKSKRITRPAGLAGSKGFAGDGEKTMENGMDTIIIMEWILEAPAMPLQIFDLSKFKKSIFLIKLIRILLKI